MDTHIAVERILETENLTDALDDDDATWLLNWGTLRVGALIAGLDDEDEAGAKVNHLLAVMRSLNALAGEHATTSLQTLAVQIRTLRERYAAAFGSASPLGDAAISRLAAALSAMAPREVMQTLLACLERAHATAPGGGRGGQAEHAPPPTHPSVPSAPRTAATPDSAEEQAQTESQPEPHSSLRAPAGPAGAPAFEAPSATERAPQTATVTAFARSPRGCRMRPQIVLGVVALIAVVVGLPSCAPPPKYIATPSHDITVYFTTLDSEASGSIDDDVVTDLDRARTAIDLASFDFNLPSITEALTRAKQRGVAVRVVVDETTGTQVLKASAAPDEQPFDALAALATAHIPVVNGGRSSGLMHHKFILIDHAILFTGAWNRSFNDTFRNNNNLLRITNPTLIANYQAKFDEMFAAHRFGAKSTVGAPTQRVSVDGFTVENDFSPPDKVMDRLVWLVQGATRSVHFMAFTSTHSDLSAAMIARAKAGAEVRGVVANRSASPGAMPELHCAGIPVAVDGNPKTMHHKVLILDGTTVVTGSFTFTHSADKYNDENLLVLHDPALAALYEQECDRVEALSKEPTKVTCPAA
jgi:phosphatidylserine/phosphatidylglycerophosphate/cardiolipin synthase-like enzyme